MAHPGFMESDPWSTSTLDPVLKGVLTRANALLVMICRHHGYA